MTRWDKTRRNKLDWYWLIKMKNRRGFFGDGTRQITSRFLAMNSDTGMLVMNNNTNRLVRLRGDADG